MRKALSADPKTEHLVGEKEPRKPKTMEEVPPTSDSKSNRGRGISKAKISKKGRKKNVKKGVNGNTTENPPLPAPHFLDDLDLMLCHEEFPRLIALVEKLKSVQKLQSASPAAKWAYIQNQRPHPKSNMAPDEILSLVDQMKEHLVTKKVDVRRGMYPLTDAMMDDNFIILQKELEFCQSCLSAEVNPKILMPTSPARLQTPTGTRTCYNSPDTMQARDGCAERTSVYQQPQKYAKWQSDILMQWMVENHKHPFCAMGQAEILASRTGLPPAQVLKWIKNMRYHHTTSSSNAHAKKHHPFMNFLFRAKQRDDEMQQQNLLRPSPIKRKKSNRNVASKKGTEHRPHDACTSKAKKDHKCMLSSLYSHSNLVPHTTLTMGSYHALSIKDLDETSKNACEKSNQKRIQPKKHLFPDLEMVGLQTVSESFEEEDIDKEKLFEPVELDFEVDEEILSVFASNWLGMYSRKNQGPVESDKMAANKTGLTKTLPMDWKSLDVSPVPIFAPAKPKHTPLDRLGAHQRSIDDQSHITEPRKQLTQIASV